MTDAPDPNAPEAAQLRAAHELLGERPSPRVRAAVLRAAAARIGGAPTSAASGAPPARPVHRWLRWQPAAAAATTVAVAVLAIGISLHVEHETPPATRAETAASRTTLPATAAAPPAAEAPAPAAAPKTAAAPPALAQSPRARAGASRDAAPPSPEDWLRRIIELRRAGRDTEADRELARFRAAFPNAKVPADALK